MPAAFFRALLFPIFKSFTHIKAKEKRRVWRECERVKILVENLGWPNTGFFYLRSKILPQFAEERSIRISRRKIGESIRIRLARAWPSLFSSNFVKNRSISIFCRNVNGCVLCSCVCLCLYGWRSIYLSVRGVLSFPQRFPCLAFVENPAGLFPFPSHCFIICSQFDTRLRRYTFEGWSIVWEENSRGEKSLGAFDLQ